MTTGKYQMSKFKCQMTGSETRARTRSTNTNNASRTRSSNAVCRPRSSVLIITNTRVHVKVPN